MKVVAIADQHGTLPAIPPCDLLIVAGDVCPDYPGGATDRIASGPQANKQGQWFMDAWLPWREAQPARMCFVTWGNHDYWGQRIHGLVGSVYPLRGAFSGARGEYTSGTVCVVDDLVRFGGVAFWLTPWSSQFRDWAFMADDTLLEQRYHAIPQTVDVLVSHQPPFGYCDKNDAGLALGSRALLAATVRVAPGVVVCGHIHGGYGQAMIDLGDGDTARVYNVAVLDERYAPTHHVTEFTL